MDEIVARPVGVGAACAERPGAAPREPSRAAPRPPIRFAPGTALWTALATALVATGTALPATADDLDIYRARLEARQKPNILFVLDYSGSMTRDVRGNDEGVPAGERRIDILRAAMGRILETNEGTINAGIGSLFGDTPSGVRWPISPLDADPRTVDPAITPGTTMIDVMQAQLMRQTAEGSTYTVDALVEAAHYFGGRPVLNGSAPGTVPANAKTDAWSAANRRYQSGNRAPRCPRASRRPPRASPATATGGGATRPAAGTARSTTPRSRGPARRTPSC